jgi:hypothetical protein
MTTAKPTSRSLAVLALPKTVPALLSCADHIVDSMTGNPSFSTPSPTLASVAQAITELRTAQAVTLSRTKGAAQARNDKLAALVKLLQLLRSYIQSVADVDAETASTVITSAGLAVKKPPTLKPRVFAATPGDNSGTVKLVTVSAGPRSSYLWQVSLDGGKTWVDLPATTQARTTVTALPAGTTVLFRYRSVTPKAGQGDWVPPISLLVR